MEELNLRYGLNPNQTPARVYMEQGELPFTVLNGTPGYINLLDALNGWQLVRELKLETGLASAASFKHVSPAGVGTAAPLPRLLQRAYHLDCNPTSDLAVAYARARGADRVSSYGDFIALSEPCDLETATLISREVSDGVIAPGYAPEALEILKRKKKGSYLILQIDRSYRPGETERRELFGITFEQARGNVKITKELLKNIPTINKELPPEAVRDLLIALITLKYTQSNSVCYAYGGQTIGVGAGQQSRVHCVRTAGNKADIWYLRQHPITLMLPFHEDVRLVDQDNAIDLLLGEEPELALADGEWQKLFTRKPGVLSLSEKREWIQGLSGVSLASEAFFPFGDSIERARRSGVSYIAQTGGSIRDYDVISTCDKYGIMMAMTGVRLFLH